MPAGCSRRSSARLRGVNVPIVPMAHEYLITRPSGLSHDLPTMRDPSLLVYFRPESGGLIMGGYERDPLPWSLDGIPADFNGKLLDGGLAALRAAARERDPQGAVARGDGGREADQRARGVHPGRRVHPRPERRPRLLGRGGLLRARARRRRRDGEARRRVDRRGNAEPRRLADGLAPLRRRLPEPRVHAGADEGDLLDLLRRQVPRPRATRGAAAARLSGVRPAAGARSRVRREIGLGARELVRVECARGRREPAPARLGRETLVAGDRRRAPRLPRGGGALRRDLVRQARGFRRGRGRAARAPLRQPRRPGGRRDHVHADAERTRRDRVRLHGHPARRGSLPDRHGNGVRSPRPRLDPPARARRRQRADSTTSPRPTPASASGDRPHGRSSLRSDRRRARLPVPARRESSRSVGCRASRSASPTSASSAGSSTVPSSSAWRSGTRSGTRVASTGSSRAATARSTRCGWRRATGSGDRTSRPMDTPYEAGLGFAVKLDKDFLGREALRGRDRAGAPPLLPHARRSASRRAGLGAGPSRGRARGPGDERRLRLHRRALDRVRLPARRAGALPGTEVEVEVFGDWVAAEVAVEPLYDPGGERLGR